ncbi:MAG: DUF348 domain-containing protein, partial [Chloroflexi bacterium]|nr:DUF348 domain-containing protein [Chloroflexota bacterium]
MSLRSTQRLILCMGLLLIGLAACVPGESQSPMLVTLVVDGRERTIRQPTALSVDELLRTEEIQLGDLDRVNPPPTTRVSDGLRITVVRVQVENRCEEEVIPHGQQIVLNEILGPGEERIGQPGRNGTEQICYRIEILDGRRQEPVPINRTVLEEPQAEIVFVGPTTELDPIQIFGTLAYISNGNAWVMRGSSNTKRPLTDTGDLDGRVFALSPDGQRLLFTRVAAGPDRETFFNRLWLLADTASAALPLPLVPGNVLDADWVPGEENMISYSTGEARDDAPGWQAHNDLWMMRVEPSTGDALSVRQLIERSPGGLYGWWGLRFDWAPDGQHLAWVGADSMGLVNLETGAFSPLLDYPVFNTYQPWSWRATVSWSPDSSLILTTVHGQPIGSELPENSPAFHVAVTDVAGTFDAEVVQNAGIWSMPRYSPLIPGG